MYQTFLFYSLSFQDTLCKLFFFSVCAEKLLNVVREFKTTTPLNEGDLSVFLIPLLHIFWNPKCPAEYSQWMSSELQKSGKIQRIDRLN